MPAEKDAPITAVRGPTQPAQLARFPRLRPPPAPTYREDAVWVRTQVKALVPLHPVYNDETRAVTYRSGMVQPNDVFLWRAVGALPEWVEVLDKAEVAELRKERERTRKMAAAGARTPGRLVGGGES